MDHYFRGYEGRPIEPNSFPELVLKSVQAWREARPSWQEVSVSVELPLISQWGYEFAKENFPSYIPEDVKYQVFRSHPVPITTASVLADKRVLIGREDRIAVKTCIPKSIDKSDEQAWKNGISLFDEIAAETLTQDILRKSLGEVTSKPGKIDPKNSGYSGGYLEILKSFERHLMGDRLFDHFVKGLVLAGMTNDRTPLDRMSGFIGFSSFDEFAVAIGRNHKYEAGNIKGNRLLYSYNSLGSYGMYPGIIGLVFTREASLMGLLSAGVAGSSLFGPLAPVGIGVFSAIGANELWQVLTRTRRVWLHEVSHYLQSGLNNISLTPVVWKLR